MPSSNHLVSLLGIRLPIIQAPMAGVSSPALAAAATLAGALGSIGAGATDAAGARAMIAEVRARTTGPFNVNLFCHRPAIANVVVETAWIERFRPEFELFGASPPTRLTEPYRSFVVDDAMLKMLLLERPPVVSFHFGLPSDEIVRVLRDAGIRLLASATSLPEAQCAVAVGMDSVIAQGWEAGGHRSVFDPESPDDRTRTRDLVRLLVGGIDLPVIAAGGIMDGAGIAAALDLGALAVQMGTAFIACDESLADADYRQALACAATSGTVMTRVISGRPARSLSNRFTAFGASIRDKEIPAYPIAYDLGKALHVAAKARGDHGFGAQWAGEGAARARAMPAAQLIATLAIELEQAQRSTGR